MAKDKDERLEFERYRQGVDKFAWLPTRLSDGSRVWLKYYRIRAVCNWRGWDNGYRATVKER